MQVHNNEVTVNRGETWTFSKLIENRDGSPYIVSSRLNNPCWLFTIKSNRYNQNDEYVLNKWLELGNLPRFEITQPISLKSIDEYTFENDSIPSGYEGDETSGYANVAIFYEKDSNGVISYKYWEYINNEKDDYDGRWVDYLCPLITTFSTDITKEWKERVYLYSISLVSGNSVENYLRQTAEQFNILYDEYTSLKELYDEIKKVEPSFVENVDVNKKLLTIDENISILESTKLYVKSDIWR